MGALLRPKSRSVSASPPRRHPGTLFLWSPTKPNQATFGHAASLEAQPTLAEQLKTPSPCIAKERLRRSRSAVPLERGTGDKRVFELGDGSPRPTASRSCAATPKERPRRSRSVGCGRYRPSCARRSAPAAGSVEAMKNIASSTRSMNTYGEPPSKSKPPPASRESPAPIVPRA